MHDKYKPEYVKFVYEMCLLGATNEAITRALGIHEKTFYRYRPVIVAMTAMRMMQPSVHKVINVIAMRYGFVSANRAVSMT
jgi:hypothetical protein